MIRSIRARIGWIYAHMCVQGGVWQESGRTVGARAAHGGFWEERTRRPHAPAPTRTVADSQPVNIVIPVARMTTTLADYLGDQPSNRPRPVYERPAPPCEGPGPRVHRAGLS